MDKFLEYAPIIIVILGFFIGYNVFVTPAQMQKALMDFERYMDNKFVTKDSHDISINEMKADIEEIKQKLDKIYDMLIKA
jgi:Tfp pilus assembly protein PilO